jgi:hypothetical protein
MKFPKLMPERISGLWDLFPEAKPVAADSMWFEAWEQNQGLALYRTLLPAGPEAIFTFEHLNDYAQIYLDGMRLAAIDRRLAPNKGVTIPARKKETALEILVEGMGHINFNIKMESDRKGLFGEIKLGTQRLDQWEVSPLPLTASRVTGAEKQSRISKKPGSHFRAKLNIKSNPADTFFDMSKYEKGMVWVNGHNLGRYWSVGP